MSENDKFYVFYTWAYGYEDVRKAFNTEEDLLDFVRVAKEGGDDSPYRKLLVIRGQEVEFEPHTIVKTWRIKEGNNE